MRRLYSLVVCALLLGAWTLSAPAQAQSEGETSSSDASKESSWGEYWSVRARYGVAFRSGTQTGAAAPITYNGLTPTDFAFSGGAFWRFIGATAQLQYEAFRLVNEANNQSTKGALLRAGIMATGRIPVGPLRLEPYVGYGFHQLPTFSGNDGVAVDAQFAAATRHTLLLGGHILLDLWRFTVELRGEYPLALAMSVPGASKAISNGFSFGGGLRVQLFELGKAHFGVVADGQYLTDTLAGKDGAGQDTLASRQYITRAGLSIDLQWRDPKVAPTHSSVQVRVADAASGSAIETAQVELETQGVRTPMPGGAGGTFTLGKVAFGSIKVFATAKGYLPAEFEGTVDGSAPATFDIKLRKEPPKVGNLKVVVQAYETKALLEDVQVNLADQEKKTNAKGVIEFTGLAPGPASLTLKLEGYQDVEDAASIVAGRTTEVTLQMVPNKKRLPATITGIVRSAKGGEPISAELEIPQLKMKTKADAKGSFSLQVPGGSYSVRISAPGYVAQTKEVTVKDGDSAIFNVVLFLR